MRSVATLPRLCNAIDLGGKKLDAISSKQSWFRDLKFRQAVSAAIDRDSIVRLVYGARGTALWGNVGPGNNNNFSASSGITIEAVLAPGWSTTNSAVIFKKAPRRPGN